MSEQAQRLPDIEPGGLPSGLDTKGVCYWKGAGAWWIYLPKAGIGCLSQHQVTEHIDGTITASPSIGLRKASGEFARHGWLEHGVWRDA
jgi:hypothetical protein